MGKEKWTKGENGKNYFVDEVARKKFLYERVLQLFGKD
jgi:hypothetical protein